MAFNYLLQSAFAQPMASLLYPTGTNAGLVGHDPFWVSKTANKAAVGVVSANAAGEGLNSAGTPIADKMLTVGVPTVDVASYTGLASPNNATYRGKTTNFLRATGVQVDAAGKVGIFLNGFDTPSNIVGGVPKSFGPDIHLTRSGVSPQVYLGAGSSQGLHMGCELTIGAQYFAPQAGATPGVGAGVSWRLSICREVNGVNTPFREDLDEIVILLGLYESRQVGHPGLDGQDTTGNITQGEHWCAGTIAAGKTSRYVANYGANMLTGVTSYNRTAQFYWDITRDHMTNILTDFGAGSVPPEEIRITGTTLSSELWDNRDDSDKTEFKPGQLGFSVDGFTVSCW